MRFSRFLSGLTVTLAASLLASTVWAHPSLLSSDPADKAKITAASRIALNFSETLLPKFSAAKLVMTAMPGMAHHGVMQVNAAVAAGADGKTMVITPAQALPAGDYRVDWRAVSSDTHPVTGSISFQVQ